MKAKIAILGRGSFIDLVNKSLLKIRNNDLEIRVYDCKEDMLMTLPRVLTELEENETDIVITGQFIKNFLEKRTSIPVIKLKVTPIDILMAIQKSLAFSNKIAIAIADLEELQYDYSILEELLRVQLHYIAYNSTEDLKKQIEKFSKTGGSVIGTGFGVTFAREYGLAGTLIYSDASISASIERAVEIIHFKRVEEKQRQQLRAIINSVRDGIIATDEQDKITIMNESARNLLNIKQNNIIGERLLKIVPDRSIRKITNDGTFYNKIIKFDHINLNASKIAISQKGTKIGNIISFQDISEIQKIEQNYRVEIESKGLIAKSEFKNIIYSSKIMRDTIEKAKRFAKTDSSILITGETGTGKELIAQSIHNHSYRNSYPFVAVNCAALPETLLESELFGYEKGAFTGADKNGKKGLFELAQHGTLFLDEVNSISPQFQARLLRAIQEKEVVRVGGHRVIPVNIRIIAAANENLDYLVQENKFRMDLYYRLNVLKINLPPLRNRPEDILPITKHFIYSNRKDLYIKMEPFIEKLCTKLLLRHFPGNIRELNNILERFIVLAEFHRNELDYYQQLLEECIIETQSQNSNKIQKIEITLKNNFKESIMDAEKSIMKKYLELQHGDKTALAEELGIGRTTLYRKLKELNLN
jgi:PAS domain S-box-containing protein